MGPCFAPYAGQLESHYRDQEMTLRMLSIYSTVTSPTNHIMPCRCSVLGMLFFVTQAITFAGLSRKFSSHINPSNIVSNTSAVFCYLRVYAITDKSKILSLLVGVSMTVFFFLELVRYAILELLNYA